MNITSNTSTNPRRHQCNWQHIGIVHCFIVITMYPMLFYSYRKDGWMNRALNHLCLHKDKTGPVQPTDDGEVNQMAMFHRHRIRNSSRETEHTTFQSPLLPTILNLQEWIWKKHSVSLKPDCQSWGRARLCGLPRQAALPTTPSPPPRSVFKITL